MTLTLGSFAALTLVALGLGIVVASSVLWGVPGIQTLAHHERRLAVDLGFLQLRVSGRRVLLLQLFGLAAAVLPALALGLPWLLPAVVPVLVAPRLWLGGRRAERVALIEAQLSGWLTTLASALGATGSLGDALASTVPLVPSPISEEVGRCLEEYRLGAPLDAALASMASRVGSRSVDGALLSLRIARNHGGDLPATLRVAAATLREGARLEGVVRTKTAEGKAQAAVVSVIPAPLVAVIHWMAPGYLDPLFATSQGVLVLGAAAALWLGAIALATKIVAVEV